MEKIMDGNPSKNNAKTITRNDMPDRNLDETASPGRIFCNTVGGPISRQASMVRFFYVSKAPRLFRGTGDTLNRSDDLCHQDSIIFRAYYRK
jgi:hypothetical protein